MDPNKFTVDAIIAYGLGEFAFDQWEKTLTQILCARLKLVKNRPLKRSLLCDERVVGALYRPDRDIRLLTVSLACFFTTDGSVPSPYLDLLFNRIKNLLSGATDIPARDAQVLGMALVTLRLADAERFEAIFEASDPAFFVRRLAASIHLPAMEDRFATIVGYVTPAFADRLIAALDPDTLDTVVNNTINSEAPNIRHLPRNRRFFAFLVSQLSPDTWWRLILGCGDLGALSSILVALGPEARVAVLATLREAKSADWAIMLGHTNASGFRVFCSEAEPLLSSTARVIFEDVAVAGMKGVVARSTWRELAVAHKRVSDLLGESRAKTAFLDQFRAQVATVDLALPPALDDLEDAAAFVLILWKERPQDRNTLANSIFEIAPEHNQWPLDHRRLTGARLLVALAQSKEMPQQVANRLFDVCANLPEDFDIATCDAKPLFLYLFNIWAVLIARAPGGLRTLAASQDERLSSRRSFFPARHSPMINCNVMSGRRLQSGIDWSPRLFEASDSRGYCPAEAIGNVESAECPELAQSRNSN